MQSMVAIKGSALRAFQIKWPPRRALGRAFRDAYGVQVELLSSDDPFVGDVLGDEPSDARAVLPIKSGL